MPPVGSGRIALGQVPELLPLPDQTETDHIQPAVPAPESRKRADAISPPPVSAPPLVQASNLWKIYQRGQEKVEALKNASLELQTGSFVFVVGPSGGGKSTLLHLLGGIDRPSSGSLTVNGFDLDQADETQLTAFRRENIGFVFQFYNLLPALNAVENIALPLLARGWTRRRAMEQAQQLLEVVGLSGRSKHKPSQLSGGEQQRVAIARAVIGEPSLVLADEPTGDLDADSTESVIKLMLDLNQRLDVTFVVATHNESLTRHGQEIFELKSGRLSGR